MAQPREAPNERTVLELTVGDAAGSLAVTRCGPIAGRADNTGDGA